MLRYARAALVCVLAVAASACSEDLPPPISVDQSGITVLNQTSNDWTDVLITVNDHFRGFVPLLKAQGRANAPLSQFSTGHGQRWVQGSQVRKVEVNGKNPDGTPVELLWEIGQPRKR